MATRRTTKREKSLFISIVVVVLPVLVDSIRKVLSS